MFKRYYFTIYFCCLFGYRKLINCRGGCDTGCTLLQIMITFWKRVLIKAISCGFATEGKVIVLWINVGDKR